MKFGPTGTILFLEDVTAKPYPDRPHADAAEAGGKVGAVCKASSSAKCWIACRRKDQGYTLEEVILRIVGDLGVPVAYGLRSGHVTRKNITLPFGVRASLQREWRRGDA